MDRINARGRGRVRANVYRAAVCAGAGRPKKSMTTASAETSLVITVACGATVTMTASMTAARPNRAAMRILEILRLRSLTCSLVAAMTRFGSSPRPRAIHTKQNAAPHLFGPTRSTPAPGSWTCPPQLGIRRHEQSKGRLQTEPHRRGRLADHRRVSRSGRTLHQGPQEQGRRRRMAERQPQDRLAALARLRQGTMRCPFA